MARIVPLLADEQQSLLAALERHRDAILWKLDGMTDEQLRTSTLPSGMTPIGLVKHLVSVEYGWFCATFDRPHEPLGFDLDDENADFRVAPDESTDDVLAFWARARDAADDAVAEIDLDTTGHRVVRRTGLDALGHDPHGRGARPPRRTHGHHERTGRRHGRRPPPLLKHAESTDRDTAAPDNMGA